MKRSQQKEWMDLGPPHYNQAEYQDCLVKLDRVGRWLGGDLATLRTFAQLNHTPRSILEVGCGGGQFAHRLALKYPQTKVVGVDIDAEAISFAKQFNLPNLDFKLQKKKELSFEEGSFDVVTTTLVCHHMTDEEIVQFLISAYKVAKQGVVINDLHRHSLASLSFAFIAPILFPSRLILHDGLLSIKRSFKKQDLIGYLMKAGIPKKEYTLTWHWAFRWLLKIEKFNQGGGDGDLR